MPEPLRILTVVHQDDAGPGVFAEAAAERGAALERWTPARDERPERPLPAYGAVLVLGGAMNVDEEHDHPWLVPEKALLAEALERGLPTLGVCLGGQLVAEVAGARVGRAAEPEIGWHEVGLDRAAARDPVLAGLPPSFLALGWHSYEFSLPPGATPLARSDRCLQAFRLDGAPVWGTQFHAEVTLEIVEAWAADHASDADAVRLGVDPAALARRTAREIGRWNRLGRTLFGRFVDVAARAGRGG